MTFSMLWRLPAIILLLITITVAPLISQRVHYLDINNGLCTNSLTDLTLDHNGNMWIGSYSGLMKYSGTHIKCLTSIGHDNHSISGPEMHSVAEDNCGYIWIGTTAGLDKIDPVTFEVEHYPIKSPFPGSSSVGYIYAVHADRYDFLWFSTDVALFRLDIITGQYEAIPTEKNEHSVPHGTVLYNGFLEVEDGLWISLAGGMTFFEFKTQRFYHQYHNPFGKSIFNVTRTIPDFQSDLEQDSKGKIWFILEHQWLASYDIVTDKLDTFLFQKPKGTWQCCWSIGVDAEENIWIGTRHGGITVFNPSTATFTSLKNNGINRLFQSDYIYSIERGPDGQMFVAHDNGLDIVDLYDRSLRERTISDKAGFMNLKYESGELSFDVKEESLFIPFYKFGFFRYNIASDSFSEFETSETLDGGVSLIQIIDDKTFVAIQRNMKEIEIRDTSFRVFEKNLLPDSVNAGKGGVIWYYQQSARSAYMKKGTGKIFHIHDGEIKVLRGTGFKPNICLSPDSLFLNYLTSELNLVRRRLDPVHDDTINLQLYLSQTDFSFSNPRHMTDDGSSVWMTGQNGILRYDYTADQLHHYGIDKGLSHS
ncbi:MAG TPA: two-component regulator propeller domain-containing protein, partial [Saprospiraceae bacterium]|nr:two-component regulator propeller domain-containing protein [Saprospiraceae bacterium]